MSAKKIDGKLLAKELREALRMDATRWTEQTGVVPKLVVVLVGDNPASLSYVKGKERACQEVGIDSEIIRLPKEIQEEALLARIDALNADPLVHGILVQLPLPKQIDENKVLQRIDPHKDVDGFHPINVGSMMVGMDTLLPCTPYGIIELIKSTGVGIRGKHAVVVGRSNIVGKPVALLLLKEDATVTICHRATTNLAKHTREADILVVAVGRPMMITKDMVKPGAIVIDVGTTKLDDGKLHGDVDFDEVKEVASHITPVPGGVGPMTITMLLFNTLKAYELQQANK